MDSFLLQFFFRYGKGEKFMCDSRLTGATKICNSSCRVSSKCRDCLCAFMIAFADSLSVVLYNKVSWCSLRVRLRSCGSVMNSIRSGFFFMSHLFSGPSENAGVTLFRYPLTRPNRPPSAHCVFPVTRERHKYISCHLPPQNLL